MHWPARENVVYMLTYPAGHDDASRQRVHYHFRLIYFEIIFRRFKLCNNKLHMSRGL